MLCYSYCEVELRRARLSSPPFIHRAAVKTGDCSGEEARRSWKRTAEYKAISRFARERIPSVSTRLLTTAIKQHSSRAAGITVVFTRFVSNPSVSIRPSRHKKSTARACQNSRLASSILSRAVLMIHGRTRPRPESRATYR